MMTWDAPGRRGKVIGSTTPVTNEPKDKKQNKPGDPKDSSDKGTTETQRDASRADQDQEKGPFEAPSPTTDKPPELDASDPSSKGPGRSRVQSNKEPTYVSLSGGQMQRVAISRAFMRADQAMLVVLE
jgi:hypothetical protein